MLARKPRLRQANDLGRDMNRFAMEGGSRATAARVAAAAVFVCALAVSAYLVFVPAKAPAAPVFSYFPSASATDGRMCVVAGNGLNTLGGNTVTLSFSVANTASTFDLGFFDGACKTVWDYNTTTNFPTTFTLYEDPLGNGTGSVQVAQWTDTTMTANAWKDFVVNTSPTAKSPSGNYFYRLTIAGTTTNSSYNAFKVRVEGATYITPTSVFGLIASKASGITTDGAYDGSWDFAMVVPQGATYVGVWDGDFDYATDTDDPNTPSTIPTWSPSSAVAEGANTGNPPDDNTAASGYQRSPAVNYSIVLPDGTTYQNNDPSGNSEWEYFRLDTAPFNASTMDYHVASLPAGIYHVKISGMDWHNLCAMKFDYPIVGFDSSGTPDPPPAPFTVGDTVWNDVNGDGVKGPTETGISGVKVNLVDAVSGAVVNSATTDATGTYTMTAWNGTYNVALDASDFTTGGALFGWRATTAATQTITVTNANVLTADFGAQVIPRVLVTSDQAASCAPSDTVSYTFSVQNNNTTTGTIDLTTSTTLGWTDTILNAQGSPISSVVLRSGETTTVTVRVNVPLAATIGSVDVMRLTGTLHGDGANGSAIGQTTCRPAVDIAPDNTGSTGANTTIDYAHTVTNGTSTTQTVTLSTTDARGWTVGLYASDGVTTISNVVVGPNGKSVPIIVRVTVPSGTASSTVDTTTVKAQLGVLSDTATDITTVGSLVTYSNIGCTTLASTFSLGASVYAKATGLTNGTAYYFVWKNPSGTTVFTSSGVVAASQVATNSYTTAGTDPVGTWTVEVHTTSGTGPLVSSQQFTVNYVANIAALYATDAATVGTTVTVTSIESNSSIATITASYVDYRIWWDSNGNGVFDAGDIYITAAGTPATYSGSGNPITHTTTGITTPPFTQFSDPGWSISNAAFPNQGNYNVTAFWKTSGGMQIDTKTSQFFSVPTLGEIVHRLPVPDYPFLIVGTIVWAGSLVWLHRKRRWLSFYALGALGTVLLALFVAQLTGFDTWLEHAEAITVAAIAVGLRVGVAALPPSGLAIQNHVGWGVFDIGIECSALLEMAAFFGLVAFYPAFGRGKKTGIIATGIAATYAINIARILIIVGMIAMLGTGWVFVAHAVVGRIFFFTGIVIVYWLLVTRPTVGVVRRRLRNAAPPSSPLDPTAVSAVTSAVATDATPATPTSSASGQGGEPRV